MRWGVPEGTRDEDGELIHDDIVLADALLAEADGLEWRRHTPTFIIEPVDPARRNEPLSMRAAWMRTPPPAPPLKGRGEEPKERGGQNTHPILSEDRRMNRCVPLHVP